MSPAAKSAASKASAAAAKRGASDAESIQLYTVNGGKKSAVIPLKRYNAMRRAIIDCLKGDGEGLELMALARAAAIRLPQWWTDEGWDEVWHTTSVKLHMEYLGELERVPKTSPHRVRLAGVTGKAGRAARTAAAAGTAAPKPKSPKEMGEAMARNMPQRTGRSLAEWAALVKEAGHTDWREAKEWLKREHGLSTMYAYMITGAALDGGSTDYSDEEGLLAAMYSGPRSRLREVHEKVKKLALSFGPGVEMVVCKTYASFRAKSQFAVVKPATREAVDIGLALPPDTPYGGRLLEAKNLGGGERNRHRIRVMSAKEVDREAEKWLRAAYEWDLKRR